MLKEGFEWRDKQKGVIKLSETLGVISGNDNEQQQIADKVIERIRYYLVGMQLCNENIASEDIIQSTEWRQYENCKSD